MGHIPKDHPRYESLMQRDLVARGVERGLVAKEGLAAHGRGEAFDYLIGERTIPSADRAAEVAAAHLLLAARPVLSVNGNTAVLVAEALAELQRELDCRVEVNLFHRTEARVNGLVAWLEDHGCRDVLGRNAAPAIPGLSSERARSEPEGVAGADVVLVPLEDGDRCEALRAMGKTVIVVDLNPFSRTARKASVTLVDNVRRAVPNVTRHVQRLRPEGRDAWQRAVDGFDNTAALKDALREVSERLATFEP